MSLLNDPVVMFLFGVILGFTTAILNRWLKDKYS